MPWTYVTIDLSDEEMFRKFYEKLVNKNNEKNLQKKSQKEFRNEKVVKRIGKRQYVKWNGYDNSSNG